MRLFIHDQPFSEEQDPDDPTLRRVEVILRIAITEPTVAVPPVNPTLIDFALDTGSDYANVYPDDLSASGIPPEGFSGGRVTVVLSDGSTTVRPMRGVTLWLYSNLPELAGQPWRMDVNRGVVVLPASTDAVAPYVGALFGMNPLIDAGLRIDLDAKRLRFSVWVPDPQGA
jgi:hypothetical protein